MKTLFISLFIFASVIFSQEAKIDNAAPNFKLMDSNGKEHSLSDFKGKYVVLEWINFDCPFVVKHYDSKNMQQLQSKYTQKDVIWLAICSSAKNKQGNFETAEINKRSKEHGAAFTAYLIDEDGKVGRMYDAKTTPHMYVIDTKGVLRYAGGIDDKPSTDKDDIKEAKNYVSAALDNLMAGKEVDTKVSKPYGCSVKY